MPAPRRVGVIADDFTGAGDVALAFERSGFTTEIALMNGRSLPPPDEKTPVWILDTESRTKPSPRTLRRIARAVKILRRWGAEFVYKKIDSTLRGPVRAELECFLRALPPAWKRADIPLPAAFVPAFPKAGRTTRNGFHFVYGKILNRTVFAKDPLNPIRTAFLPELLSQKGARPPAVWIPDVADQSDLRRAARRIVGGGEVSSRAAVGSAGLAEELARRWACALTENGRRKVKKRSPPNRAAVRRAPPLYTSGAEVGPAEVRRDAPPLYTGGAEGGPAEVRRDAPPLYTGGAEVGPAELRRDAPPPVMVVVGSVHPRSRRQARRLKKACGSSLKVLPERANGKSFLAADRVSAEKRIPALRGAARFRRVIEALWRGRARVFLAQTPRLYRSAGQKSVPPNSGGTPRRVLSPERAMRLLLNKVKFWSDVLGVRRFLVTGGETARGLCDLWKLFRWRVQGSVATGVCLVHPRGGGNGRRYGRRRGPSGGSRDGGPWMILKPGGFGGDSILIQCVRRLQRVDGLF